MTQVTQQYGPASVYGALGSVVGNSVAHPLDTVKIVQQLNGEGPIKIAKDLLRKEGVAGLYRGYPPTIIRSGLNGAFAWPSLKAAIRLWENTPLPAPVQHAAAGSTVAAASVLLFNPLQKMAIAAMAGEPTLKKADSPKLSFQQRLRESWQGAGASWRHLSISWGTFTAAQKYFRPVRTQEKAPTVVDHLATGAKVAAVVTALSNPTDVATTYRMQKGIGLMTLLETPRVLARALMVSFLSRWVRNSVSAATIEVLDL